MTYKGIWYDTINTIIIITIVTIIAITVIITIAIVTIITIIITIIIIITPIVIVAIKMYHFIISCSKTTPCHPMQRNTIGDNEAA